MEKKHFLPLKQEKSGYGGNVLCVTRVKWDKLPSNEIGGNREFEQYAEVWKCQ